MSYLVEFRISVRPFFLFSETVRIGCGEAEKLEKPQRWPRTVSASEQYAIEYPNVNFFAFKCCCGMSFDARGTRRAERTVD